MILDRKQYAMSPGFWATSNNLFDIFRVLKTLKQIVAERSQAVSEQ